jgi:hypothetical protein
VLLVARFLFGVLIYCGFLLVVQICGAQLFLSCSFFSLLKKILMALAPPENKGMTLLDRDAFSTTLATLALSVPSQAVHSVTKQHEK